MIKIAKKTRSGRIKFPFGEYSWYNELDQPTIDEEILKSQIDSFLLVVENADKVYTSDLREELKAFTQIIVARGHLAKLEKKYQDKFFKITKYVKDQWDGPSAFLFPIDR